MDLFNHAMQQDLGKRAPLAARLRPRTLDEFVGQEDIVGEGKQIYPYWISLVGLELE
jgi:putative ATPase